MGIEEGGGAGEQGGYDEWDSGCGCLLYLKTQELIKWVESGSERKVGVGDIHGLCTVHSMMNEILISISEKWSNGSVYASVCITVFLLMILSSNGYFIINVGGYSDG